MSLDYNQRYYNFIVDQIKDIRYCPYDLLNVMIETSKHYSIHPININDFELAFEWAVADVFGGGCEIERRIR